MEVILRSVKHRVKKPIEIDHYWYDPKTKQRLHGRGGKMIFVYDQENKKTVPRIVDAEEWVWEDSYKDIEDWVSDKNVQVLNRSPGYYMIIEVDPHQLSDLEDDLHRHKIRCDYDNKQLQKETGGGKTWQNLASKLPKHLRI